MRKSIRSKSSCRFLQLLFEDFTVLPLVVGDADPNEVAEVLDAVWGGEETRIVISSDLSHFLPYDDARAADRSDRREDSRSRYPSEPL